MVQMGSAHAMGVKYMLEQSLLGTDVQVRVVEDLKTYRSMTAAQRRAHLQQTFKKIEQAKP